jgi:toxin ParE1/3/4
MARGFRLTPRAVADLDVIAVYTQKRWGAAQMVDYLRALNRRFEWLADHPLAGRERGDVHPGYRSFREGSHLVFYIVSDEHVDIIGIPHQSMDIGPDPF